MNGTNAAYASGTASEVTRQSEVSTEVETLANQCEHIDKQVTALEQRLHLVLAQRSEESGNGQKNPEPVRVPLAQNIHDRAYHLSLISMKLESIIGRIEL